MHDQQLLKEFRARAIQLKSNYLSPLQEISAHAPKLESRDRTYSSFVYSQNAYASVSSFNEDGQSGGSQQAEKLPIHSPTIAEIDREAEIRGENYLYELATSFRLDVDAIREAIFPAEEKQDTMSLISVIIDISGNDPDTKN